MSKTVGSHRFKKSCKKFSKAYQQGVVKMIVPISQLSLARKYLQNRRIKLKIILPIKRILRCLSKSFFGSNELRIWQTYDRFGNNWWHAFDPLTGRHNSVNSKAKLQTWIKVNYPDKSPKRD